MGERPLTAEEILARLEETGLPDPPDIAALDTLAALAAEAADPDELMHAAEIAGGDAGLYLRGEAHARAGEEEEALSPWLTLCDHLSRAGASEALSHMACRVLDLRDSPAAARSLLRAGAETQDWGPALERAEAVLRSLPKDPRAALLAGRAREAAGDEGAGAFYARALEGAVRDANEETAEEAFLAVIEEEDAAVLGRGLRALVDAARAGRAAWAVTLQELGEAAFVKAGLDSSLLEWGGEAVREGSDLEPLRPALARALKRVHAGKAYLADVLEKTGIEEESPDLATVFARMDELLAFPPGRYVAHHSYGVGPVLDTDGEHVTADFPKTGPKTMTLSMARKALALLPRDDIRVQLALEGETLAHEIDEDPAAVLVRGLRHLGGKATSKQLREVLSPEVIPEKGWNTWWRKARDAALGDPRVGTAEAYREVYRLATGAEEEMLPDLRPIPDRTKAFGLLRRVLRDRPEREEEAREAYLPLLRAWLEDDLPPQVRAGTLLLVYRWDPEGSERLVAQVGEMFAEGLRTNVLNTAAQQETLLAMGLRSEHREEAALWGLVSRFATVREAALRKLQEEGEEALQSGLRKILSQGEAGPILQVARWWAAGGEGGFGEGLPPWRLTAALLAILPKDQTGKLERDLLEILDPDGPLALRLAGVPCPTEMYGALRMGLRSLRTHFQVSHQARRFLEAAGAGEAAREDAAPPGEKEEEEDRGTALLAGGLLVTKTTVQRLERQAEEYKRDLQTTIPAAILTARMHGDLSENAEYKAAKEKQALTSQKLDELLQSLQSVRFIEDLPWEDGRILPGAEILLEGPEGDRREIWLLGDGEDYLGAQVVSYRSPIGQALLWQREGGTVRLPQRGEDVAYRIAQVTRRLPEAGQQEEET